MDCEHDGSQYGAISEGTCPRCDIRMDLCSDCTGRQAHGTCPCCDGGWSRNGDTIRVHITMRNSFLPHGTPIHLSDDGDSWLTA